MPKLITLDDRASKEIDKFPKGARVKIWAYIEKLKQQGELKEPFAKKLKSNPDIYEIRVRYQGIWRVIYAYLHGKEIILLSGFQKQTQKTPMREIDKAVARLHQYT